MKRNLFLLRQLVKRDFQGRYVGSVLGFVWSFVQPLWLLLLYSFVFSTVMQISVVGERTDSFGIFLYCGLLPWAAFQEGVSRAATAITDNANLVKKLSFPSSILVFTVVIAALLHEAIALGLFAVVLLVLGELAWGGLPLLVVAVVLQLALTVGLGLLLAAAQVFFRDTAQLMGMVFTGWFFLTPIVYPLGLVPERYRYLVELNPMTPLVGLYRQALLGGEIAWVPGLGGLAIFATVALFIGVSVFRWAQPAFVDEI